MRETKEKKETAKYQLMLTVLLLLVCVISVVGAAWARYRSESYSYLSYTLRKPDNISLWGGYDSVTGEFSDERKWQISGDEGTLDFYVSNGTAESYAERDKKVSIRLFSSLNEHELQVWLTLDGTEWKAETQPIMPGTDLYKNFGPGEVHIFRDKTGAELNWELEGGDLSLLQGRFCVTGLPEQNESTISFQVLVTEEAS